MRQLISLLHQFRNLRFAVPSGSLETRAKLRARLLRGPPSHLPPSRSPSKFLEQATAKVGQFRRRHRRRQSEGRLRPLGATASATLSRKSDPSLFRPHFELSFNWTRTEDADFTDTERARPSRPPSHRRRAPPIPAQSFAICASLLSFSRPCSVSAGRGGRSLKERK